MILIRNRAPVIDDVPPTRLRRLNRAPVRERGAMVLYWMISARRRAWNPALQRAAWWAAELQRPLVILEALRLDYPWASDRFHAWAIQGMRDNARDFTDCAALYHPYVEPAPGAASGLLAGLAGHAAVVVSDDHPGFFFPRMLAAAATRLPVALEVVDGNGLLPMRAADHAYARAVDFRRFLQRELPAHLRWWPMADPLRGLPRRTWSMPTTLRRRFPPADLDALLRPDGLASLAIDHQVPPVAVQGGARAGRLRLRRFLGTLGEYLEARRTCEPSATSALSPYLHWGHVGSHQVVAALLKQESWSPGRLAATASGAKEGWWGLSTDAEAFIDQLVTWRELGFNACCHLPRCTTWASLPAWARATLVGHAHDPRPQSYSLRDLERAATNDPLWNAAQRQLRHDGIIHNYLRMLWGKHLIAWSPSPRTALRRAFALNDRWAIDGRDPNSITGIMWLFGRYDHPWPPERSVSGSIRYMSSRSAMQKLRLRPYLERWGRLPDP